MGKARKVDFQGFATTMREYVLLKTREATRVETLSTEPPVVLVEEWMFADSVGGR